MITNAYQEFAQPVKQHAISKLAKLCNDGLYSIGKITFDTTKSYNNKITAEYLLQYTYFYHLPLALYMYFSQPTFQLIWLLDIIGITTLSINSYYMHNVLYKHHLKTSSDLMPSFFHDEIKEKYLCDVASIHFRSFLFLVSNSLLYGFYTPILISFVLHCITFTCFLYYIENNKHGYSIDENVKILIKFPILFDIIAITIFAYNAMNSNFILIHNVIFVLLIMSVLIYSPFYSLNHVVIHLLLFYQTFILLQANIMPFTCPNLLVDIHDYDMSLISKIVNKFLLFCFYHEKTIPLDSTQNS